MTLQMIKTFSFPKAIKSVGLPLGILILMAMMVIPLPSILLDVFFTSNILVSLIILMVALHTFRPLEFSSFPYHSVQSIGALPGGTGRSGVAGSKELDLCYNFHFCGFSILAIRRSGNPSSMAAPQMICTQVELTRVRGKIDLNPLAKRKRNATQFHSQRNKVPDHIRSLVVHTILK